MRFVYLICFHIHFTLIFFVHLNAHKSVVSFIQVEGLGHHIISVNALQFENCPKAVADCSN